MWFRVLRLSMINLLMISSSFYSEVDFESPLPEDGYLSVGPPCNLFEPVRVIQSAALPVQASFRAATYRIH